MNDSYIYAYDMMLLAFEKDEKFWGLRQLKNIEETTTLEINNEKSI